MIERGIDHTLPFTTEPVRGINDEVYQGVRTRLEAIKRFKEFEFGRPTLYGAFSDLLDFDYTFITGESVSGKTFWYNSTQHYLALRYPKLNPSQQLRTINYEEHGELKAIHDQKVIVLNPRRVYDLNSLYKGVQYVPDPTRHWPGKALDKASDSLESVIAKSTQTPQKTIVEVPGITALRFPDQENM